MRLERVHAQYTIRIRFFVAHLRFDRSQYRRFSSQESGHLQLYLREWRQDITKSIGIASHETRSNEGHDTTRDLAICNISLFCLEAA